MCEIAINTSTNQQYSEIVISGTNANFTSVTKQLTKISTRVFFLKHKPNNYYPVPMKLLAIEPVEQSNGLITALIHDEEFKLSGDVQAFQKLMIFLESLSNLSPNEHFHLDWFANGDMLASATDNMSFVFTIE